MWQKVETDDDVLSIRSGGSRDHKSLSSGPAGDGSQGSYSARHGQAHVPSYPPVYFPYPMAPSMFASAGGADARSRIGLHSHPYFSHLPRLGYSTPHPHLPPPLLHSDGGGGGHYPRPGRPWWTVPPFPPPSHLHHPHHGHPPPNESDSYKPISTQEQQPPPSQLNSVVTTGHDNMASTTASVPRTSSRNAYSQQRLSILKKQQQQKEQASKNARENDRKNLYVTTSGLKSLSTDESPRTMQLTKSSEGTSLYKDDTLKEEEGVSRLEVAKLNSKYLSSQ